MVLHLTYKKRIRLKLTEMTSFVRLWNKLFKRNLATTVSEDLATITPKSTLPKFSEKIVNLQKSSRDAEVAHFRVGGDQRYFPKARVILLRPNAKHTPYQAKFIVPKSFNKMDLRDYLYHIYGLRALNVTTQLLPGRFVRAGTTPRHRVSQLKKMTIDMEQPFIWPSANVSKDNDALSYIDYENEIGKYRNEMSSRVGSDHFKPIKMFDGVYKYNKDYVKHSVEAFVPKRAGRQMMNKKLKALAIDRKSKETESLNNYLQK